MVTTVALKEETLDMLKGIRVKLGAQTLDETIRKLIMFMKKPKTSMRGMAKHTPEFEREELDRFV